MLRKLASLLLSPDPAESTGGTPSPDPIKPPPDPKEKAIAPPLPPNEPAPNQAPPPAAKTVLEGTKTERELELETNLKNLQQRTSELEDENRQLKTPPKTPPPAAPEKKSWLSGGTFFD